VQAFYGLEPEAVMGQPVLGVVHYYLYQFFFGQGAEKVQASVSPLIDILLGRLHCGSFWNKSRAGAALRKTTKKRKIVFAFS